MKDYSQWGEAKIIMDFFKGKPPGRFLDIGAYDGLSGSNTRNLSDIGWSGVCIEANPFNFPRLLENHRGNNKVECVLGAMVPDNTGRIVKFYDAAGQIGTTLSAHKLAHHVKRVYRVSSITTFDILATFGSEFDFVSLDIEGADLPVLKDMGPILVNTKLLCVEDAIPNSPFSQDYYNQLMAAAAAHGFTKVVATTSTQVHSCNTLLAKP